ncbi:MAG: SDR family NAD(P)-dependent oxidoreductase [Anaerolineales bacterium]|nr:SDR family NAD(P)-dependent oxidoreductase [Anaerolineales bacterium]MCK5428662.1 SDR family NAD(P)-dependent oxidoreductase [Anaerolineales bacterium]
MTKKTLIITGASRGLGAASARFAAQMGANVVLMARSAKEIERIVEEIQSNGGQALAVPGDVGSELYCNKVIAKAVQRFGGLDALVNNASIIEPIEPLTEADPQAWEANWRVNLLGPLMLIKAALPYLRQTKGRVINVSSGAAVKVIRSWGAYSSTKAALNHVNRFLAEEEPDITAIAFRPGVVDTSMQATIRSSSKMSPQDHALFMNFHTDGELLPPELPGRALARLALYAPHEWSGEFISWDDERIAALEIGN